MTFAQTVGLRSYETLSHMGQSFVATSFQGYEAHRSIRALESRAETRVVSVGPRPGLVFLIKPRVAAFEAHLLSRDPHPLHIGADVEDIAVGRKKRCFLAGLDGAEAVRHAEHFRRVQGDAFERL